MSQTLQRLEPQRCRPAPENEPTLPPPAPEADAKDEDDAEAVEPQIGILEILTAHSLCALQFLIPRTSSPGHAHASN